MCELSVPDQVKKCEQKIEEDSKFTGQQKLALVMLTTVDFASFCLMSVMAPFYPKEAAKKGMSNSMAGFVFGFYALVIFLSSPIFGKIIPKIGLMFLFTGGILLSGLCSLVFGTLYMVEDYTTFSFLSFFIRGLEALGTSAYSTASYVIVINLFPKNAGAVRGLLETFVGLGLSVGPAIGGLLYEIGGFGLPFYVIGLILIIVAPLNNFLLELPKECSVDSKSGSFTTLLKLPSAFVVSSIIVVVSMTWSFLDPTLEPHLEKFHLTPGNVGLVFLLLSGAYGLSSPIWGWLSDQTPNYYWFMIAGLFSSFTILIFLGPSPLLTFLEDSLPLNIVALSLLGISVAMGLIPTYQALLDSAIIGGFPDNLGTHSLIAGFWSCVYSLGEVLGPILGGTLMEHFDFATTSTVFAFLNLITAILASCYFLSRCSNKLNVSDQK